MTWNIKLQKLHTHLPTRTQLVLVYIKSVSVRKCTVCQVFVVSWCVCVLYLQLNVVRTHIIDTNHRLMAISAELSMKQATALSLQQEIKEKEHQVRAQLFLSVSHRLSHLACHCPLKMIN